MTANSLTQCCAPGCSTMKASHLLMCWTHWAMLPSNLRERVYSSHRQMQDGEGSRNWLIARELARLHVATRLDKDQDVIDGIEAEIERLEDVQL